MKKALTIGELLVTLSIIGVIATLVLPGIMKDYQNKLYITRLKKTIELIDNAVNQACIDSGVSYFYQTPYAVTDNATVWNTFLQKYFKGATLKTTNPFADSYMDISTQNSDALNFSDGDRGFIKLADGGALAFSCESKESCTFIIDVNSTDRPNTGGRDLFTINFNPKDHSYSDSESSVCGTDNLGSGCYTSLIENNWDITY
jgi:type II secretory pathway pseudopilin PulG